MTDTLSSFIASVALVAACGAAVDALAGQAPVTHTRAGLGVASAQTATGQPAAPAATPARALRVAPACCPPDDAIQE